MQNTYPTTPDFNNLASLSALPAASLQQSKRATVSRPANGANGPKSAVPLQPPPPSPQSVNRASFVSNAQVRNPSYSVLSSHPVLPLELPNRLPEPLTAHAHEHVPLPGLSLSQLPTSMSQARNSPKQPLTYVPAPSVESQSGEISSGQATRLHQDQTSAFADRQNAKESTPEEGELSDGELQEDDPVPVTLIESRKYRSNVRKMSQSKISRDNEHTINKAHSRSHVHRVPQGPKLAIDIGTKNRNSRSEPDFPIASEDEGSLSSYNPPSASTPDRPIDPEPFTTRTADPTGHMASSNVQTANAGAEGPGDLYLGKSIQQWRDLAKRSITSLIPYGIRYEDLVDEGLDAGLLQRLYQESGLQSALGHEHPAPTLNGNSTLPAQSSISRNSNIRPNKTGNSPKSIQLHNDKDFRFSSGSLAGSQRLEPSTVTQIETENLSSAEVETASAQIQQPPPSAAAPLSRKDLIAQRLAARSSNTLVSQSPETVPVPTTLSKPKPSLKATTSITGSHTGVNEPESHLNALPPVSPVKPSSTSTSTNRPKSKAQTDLVRQKMELLKRQVPVKVDVQSSQQSAAPSPFEPPSNISAPSQAMTASGTAEGLLPMTPSAVPPSTPSGSQIPGLFLASPDLDELISSAKQQISRDLPPPVNSNEMKHATQPLHLPPKPEKINTDLSHGQYIQQDASVEKPVIHSSLTASTEGAHSPKYLVGDRQPSKRPLASDSFDDSQPPLKRPFGRKESYDHVEIVLSDNDEEDASEDASEDVGMDLEEQSESNSRGGQETGLESITSNIDGNLYAPSTAQMLLHQATDQTPSAMQTPTREKEAEKGEMFKTKALESAERDIARMRMRIAEIEARNRAKKAASRADSPKLSTPATPVLTSTPEGSPATQISPEPLSTTSTPLPALGDSARAEVLRQKLLRRRQIQSGLPGIDAKVENARAMLALKQAELAEARKREMEMLEEAERLEASIREDLEQRSTLVRELEQLGVNVDNKAIEKMPTNALEAKRNQLLEQQMQEPALPPQLPSKIIDPETSISENNGVTEMGSPRQAFDDEFKQDIPESIDASASNFTQPMEESPGSERSDDGSEQVQVEVAAVTGNSPGGVALPMEENPGLAPDPVQDSDGSISMSDGDSDAYEPMETISNDENADSDSYEPPDLSTTGAGVETYSPEATTESQPQYDDDDDAMSIDDDSYEPADETPVAQDLTNETGRGISVGPVANGVNGVNGIEPSQSVNSGEVAADDIEDTYPLRDPKDVAESNEATQTSPTTFPDERESGSQPPAAQETKPEQLAGPARSHVDLHFHPYDSPFAKLRNFRFSENFLDTVPGGYRSLTYSGRINPDKFLCATELSGEACTDSNCPDQHLRDMLLTDDKILVEMSSAKDFKDKEERDRFVTGLKQIIADLRSRGVKEFTMVANELAAYRRRFQQAQTAQVSL